VRVLPLCRRDAGVPGVRFFHPRWTSLERGLAAADADLYYHNTSEYVTGQVAWWCRRRGRKFVFSVANDRDVMPEMIRRRAWRERVLYQYGLRRADRLIVQTRTQQELVLRHFGLQSVVVPMPCPPPDRTGGPPEPGPPRLLWAARIARVKRLELLLDLAESCPDLAFDVAGAPEADNEYTRALMARGRAIPNVHLLGRVERAGMAALYARATALVCTSAHEGFPNTFLEAWSHGLPVLSTFDPDGLIRSHRLGAVVDDVPGLAREVRLLVSSEMERAAVGARARQYYLAHHTPEAALNCFDEIFREALGSSPRSA
jgi:glycosyltransferase involved in cell wall biosynthesis